MLTQNSQQQKGEQKLHSDLERQRHIVSMCMKILSLRWSYFTWTNYL